jgi:hypothetical protein
MAITIEKLVADYVGSEPTAHDDVDGEESAGQ